MSALLVADAGEGVSSSLLLALRARFDVQAFLTQGAARDWLRRRWLEQLGAIIALDLSDGPAEDLVVEIRRHAPDPLILVTGRSFTAGRTLALLELGAFSVPEPVVADELLAFLARVNGHSAGATEPDILGGAATACAEARGLSSTQATILRCYLGGMSDKEIAHAKGRTANTVHQHWRRMARKANTLYKGGVVADFHRFLSEWDGSPSRMP